MIDGIYDVALRYTRDARWEAYALSHSAYGFGDTLAEARKDITEALALLVEQPENRIRLNEYHERLISAADEHHADVWLRVHHDADPNCALSRREIVGNPTHGAVSITACHSTVTSSCWHACPTIYSVTFSHRWPAPTDSTWLFPTPIGFVCGVCIPMRPPAGHPNPKSTLHPSTWAQAPPSMTSFE